MPRIRCAPLGASTLMIAAALALLTSTGSAQLTGPRVTWESTRSMLDFAMREGGIVATLTTPFTLTKSMDWITSGSIVEKAGASDKLTLSWNSEHFTASHDEEPNLNHYVASFIVDGAVEHTAEPVHEGDFRDCRIVPHEDHWDIWIATMTFTVDPNGQILFWSWMLDGVHQYALPQECSLGGRVDDGGLTAGRLGSAAAFADTLANLMTIDALIGGVTLGTVLQASLRAGPTGPAMVTIPAEALGQESGALTIAARDVPLDHAGVPALYAGEAYLEVVTTEGVVGGFVRPITPSVTAVAPTPPITELAFGLSPNPAVRTLRLQYRAPGSEPVSLEVHDVGGRRVRALDIAAGDGTYALDLVGDDGARLSPGIYFATLRSGERRATRRFVVTN
jgi:hypothetical protein